MGLPDKEKHKGWATLIPRKLCKTIAILIIFFGIPLFFIRLAFYPEIDVMGSSSNSTRATENFSPAPEIPGTLHSWPWMVALKKTEQSKPCCNGVLLSDRHVLTTAYCVGPCASQNSPLIFRLNGPDGGSEHAQNYIVKSPDERKDFRYKNITKYDFVILELGKSVQLNDYVQPATLAQTDKPRSSQKAIVVEYGKTELKELPVQVLDSNACLRASKMPHSVSKAFLCARSKTNRQLSHDIYLGAPLLVQASSGEWEVVGLQRRGRNFTRVYIKVYKYLQWIKEATEETSHHWPWVVALKKFSRGEPCCTGVLLDDRHALTAAHCLHDCIDGSTDSKVHLQYNKDNSESKTYTISSVNIHENFVHSKTGVDDIAILNLKTNVQFNNYVQPARLAVTDETYYNQDTMITGYPEDQLEELRGQVVDCNECSDPNTRSSKSKSEWDKFLCAQVAGPCENLKGHSGGPMQVQAPSGKWNVIGIVSYKDIVNSTCCIFLPKISEYKSWINKITGPETTTMYSGTTTACPETTPMYPGTTTTCPETTTMYPETTTTCPETTTMYPGTTTACPETTPMYPGTTTTCPETTTMYPETTTMYP